MADDITDVYVATEAGDAGWQSLSALAAAQVDAKLPIESVDGTVTLDSPSANTFTVSTGGTAIEVWKKGTANPIYVTPRPDVNNFKGVRYRTYAGAAAGSSVVAALSVNDSIDATVLSSFCSEPAVLNGSGTLDELRGYFAEDGGGTTNTYKAFTSDVKDRRNEADEADRCATWLVYGSGSAPSYFGGNIQAPSVSGLADTDASIELGADAVIKSETGYVGLNSNQNGWNNKLNVTGNNFIYNTGTINQNTIRYVKELDGTQTQVVREGVYGLTTTVNDWGAQEGHTIFQNLVGPHVIEAKETIRLITQKTSSDPNVTNPTAGIYLVCSGPDVQQAQLTTAQCGVVCIDTSVQLQTQSSPNSSRRTRFTVKDQGVVSEVDIKTPSVSAPASDASIELGTELLTSNHTPTQPNSIATKQTVDDKIWVGTTAEYQAISQKNPTTLYCLTD